jgi:hypothetical protein
MMLSKMAKVQTREAAITKITISIMNIINKANSSNNKMMGKMMTIFIL